MLLIHVFRFVYITIKIIVNVGQIGETPVLENLNPRNCCYLHLCNCCFLVYVFVMNHEYYAVLSTQICRPIANKISVERYLSSIFHVVMGNM